MTADAAISKDPIAILFQKDGKAYWVKGYEYFDPTEEHSTLKGLRPLELDAPRLGCAWIVGEGQQGKPVQYEKSRLTIVQPGQPYHTFQEVFGAGSGSGTVIHAQIEPLDDDLEIGLTPAPSAIDVPRVSAGDWVQEVLAF